MLPVKGDFFFGRDDVFIITEDIIAMVAGIIIYLKFLVP